MTDPTLRLMDLGHDVSAGVAGVTVPGPHKIRSVMAAMAGCPVGMAIQTTDGQGVILNNGLDAGIARLDIGRPARIVAHATTASMKSNDAIRTRPGVGEQRIGTPRPAASMTGVTERPSGKIGSSTHQYRVGGSSMLGMTIEVSGVAGDTLTTSRLAESAANERSISGAVTHLTVEACMNLACGYIRRCGRSMAT